MMQILSRFACARRSGVVSQLSALTVCSLVMLDAAGPANAAPPAEVGVWVDHDGKGAIEIKQCGQALCGNIVWLKQPLNDEGQPLYDRRNPDAGKRNRPICGLPVIGNVRQTAEGWDEGWIYSPEEGNQYDVAMKATGAKLTVTGYKGIKLFSKTFVWTRAPASLQKCNGASQTKAAPGAVPVKAATPPTGAPAAPAAKKPASATATGQTPAKTPPATAAGKPAADKAKAATTKPTTAPAATAAKVPAPKPAVKPAATAAKPPTTTAKKKMADEADPSAIE